MKQRALPESRFGGTADGELVTQASCQSADHPSKSRLPAVRSRSLRLVSIVRAPAKKLTGEWSILTNAGDVNITSMKRNGVPTARL